MISSTFLCRQGIGQSHRETCSSVCRPDLRFLVKAECRGIAAPGASDIWRLKRIARYLYMAPQAMIASGPESEAERAIRPAAAAAGRVPPEAS